MSKFQETEFGTIPIEWGLKKIIDLKSNEKTAIAMGPFGSNIKAENFVTEGIPVIRGTNLNYDKYVDGEFVYLTEGKADELKGSICKPGDIVFTHRGTIGQVGLIPDNKFGRYIISQSGMKLTVDSTLINNEFLFYFFKSKYGQFQLLKTESQVGVPSMSNPLTSLKAIEVPVPRLSEQKMIAEVLSRLDDKIDLLRRQKKTLELLAETIFRQWFVEEMNENFEILKLAELCSLITDGKHGDCKDEFNSGYYFVSVKDIKNGKIEYENARQITKDDFEETHRRTNFAPGDILLTNSGTIGRMAIARDIPETRRTTFQKSVAILKPKHKIVTSNFLYCLLKSHLLSIIELAGGTTQSNLLLGDLRDFEIKYPGHHAVCEFENKISPLFKKVFSNDSQIKTLTQLRDALLPKLMSGEVRVI